MELRQLREEKRLFRLRADIDREDIPAFADVLARIAREESTAIANEPDVGRVVVLAKAPRLLPLPRKTEQVRTSARKSSVSRWAQTVVVCASTAAAAWSLFGVTPPKTEDAAAIHPHGDEMEIGADRLCTPENSSASAEVLASLPPPAPPREIVTKMPIPSNEDSGTCSAHRDEECGAEEGSMERICGEESSAVCRESGP
jgi:hypothetical protein